MGLAVLEMTRDLEETFQIEIPDEAFEHVNTPGRLIDFIASKVAVDRPSPCLSLRAFNRLRRVCVATGLVSREEFTLDRRFTDWLPLRRRKKIWANVAAASQIPTWPRLVRPPILAGCLAYSVGTVLAFPLLFAAITDVLAFLLATAVVVLIGILLAWLTSPLRILVPAEARTPRDLVRHLVATAPRSLVEDHAALTRERIAEVVRSHVVNLCGEERYREDADFWKDLCID